MDGFTKHLVDAIKVNIKRRKQYAKLTNNKSKSLSNQLIIAEIFILPIAFLIDLWAKKYNKKGIPIVVNDFASMDHILPFDKKTIYTNELTDAELKLWQENLMKVKREINNLLKQNNFYAISILLKNKLLNIIEFEKEKKIHFAMTKHLLESLGLIAINSIDYSKQSVGETSHLSKTLIYIHLIGLNFVLSFDRKAQKIHKMGVGIIVNDVPEIPFIEKIKKLERA